MEFSDFLTQYMNQTEDDFNKDAADYGKQVAGNMLVVCAIAKLRRSIRMPFMMRGGSVCKAERLFRCCNSGEGLQPEVSASGDH